MEWHRPPDLNCNLPVNGRVLCQIKLGRQKGMTGFEPAIRRLKAVGMTLIDFGDQITKIYQIPDLLQKNCFLITYLKDEYSMLIICWYG